MRKLINYITSATLLIMLLFTTMSKAEAVNYTYITDLAKLPAVTGDLAQVNDSKKTGKVLFNEQQDGYGVNIEHPNGVTYILASSNGTPMTIQLPGLDDHDSHLILNSGVLFKGENDTNLIYYELQNPSRNNSNLVTNVFEDENITLNGFRPYVIWDYVNGIYDKTTQLTVYGKHFAGSNRRAYVDVVFPIDLDELLMIELKWSYRYKNLFGKWTDWNIDQVVRYKDEHVNATSFWNEFKRIFTPFAALFPSTYDYSRFNQETIRDLGKVNSTYKHNYTDAINKALNKQNKRPVTTNDLFSGEHSTYRIYLDTYDKGFYTDYEIDDILLLDLMYIYQGEYYHPQIEDVDWTSVGGKNADNNWTTPEFPNIPEHIKNFNDWLKSKFKSAYIIVLVIIIVIAMTFVAAAIRWIRRLFGRY